MEVSVMKQMTFVVLFIGAMLLGYVTSGIAGVDVNIGINIPLPKVVIPAPPPMILIPGTYAYFVPDIDVDIIFYHGYWYRPYKGRWYRANDYNGTWITIAAGVVPSVLINLPSGFRNVPPGHTRIPYGQLKKNWKTWEKEKHWDKVQVKKEKEYQKAIEIELTNVNLPFKRELYSNVNLSQRLKDNKEIYVFLEQAPYARSSYFVDNTFDNGLNERLNNYLKDAINSILSGSSAESAAETLIQGYGQVLKQYENEKN